MTRTLQERQTIGRTCQVRRI
ncbi:MAG: hypothetical protein QOJ89_5015, partial [bacterium]